MTAKLPSVGYLQRLIYICIKLLIEEKLAKNCLLKRCRLDERVIYGPCENKNVWFIPSLASGTLPVNLMKTRHQI